jgi:hypothetical protein
MPEELHVVRHEANLLLLLLLLAQGCEMHQRPQGSRTGSSMLKLQVAELLCKMLCCCIFDPELMLVLLLQDVQAVPQRNLACSSTVRSESRDEGKA